MEFSKELLTKAKSAENSAALLALAKENGMELTQEEADAYFAELHKTGELSDDELENVTGGGCRKNGHLVVSIGYGCDLWRCKRHPYERRDWVHYGDDYYYGCPGCKGKPICNHCYYCKYTGGLWLCMNPDKSEKKKTRRNDIGTAKTLRCLQWIGHVFKLLLRHI